MCKGKDCLQWSLTWAEFLCGWWQLVLGFLLIPSRKPRPQFAPQRFTVHFDFHSCFTAYSSMFPPDWRATLRPWTLGDVHLSLSRKIIQHGIKAVWLFILLDIFGSRKTNLPTTMRAPVFCRQVVFGIVVKDYFGRGTCGIEVSRVRRVMKLC